MTRYTRSVIPGRNGGEGGRDLDRAVFGQRNSRDAANDVEADEPEPMATEEADLFVTRANPERRKGGRRRKSDKSDYKTLPDARSGYRAPNEGGMRGPLLLVGALIVVGVFGAVVFNAYRDGVRAEDGETPTLAAAGPFKSKPEFVTPSRVAASEDASVFERVESGPKPAATDELPPTPDVRVEKVVEPAAAPAPAPVKTEAPKPAPVKAAPVQTAAAPPLAKAVVAPPKAVTPTPAPATKPVIQTAAVAPAPKAAAPVAAAPAPVLAGGFAPAFSRGGNYLVQIGAATSEAGADAEWSRRAKASPGLFGAAEKVVVRADVNGKTVYRVRAGSFATVADADAFCGAFKAAGGDCFRTAK